MVPPCTGANVNQQAALLLDSNYQNALALHVCLRLRRWRAITASTPPASVPPRLLPISMGNGCLPPMWSNWPFRPDCPGQRMAARRSPMPLPSRARSQWSTVDQVLRLRRQGEECAARWRHRCGRAEQRKHLGRHGWHRSDHHHPLGDRAASRRHRVQSQRPDHRRHGVWARSLAGMDTNGRTRLYSPWWSPWPDLRTSTPCCTRMR